MILVFIWGPTDDDGIAMGVIQPLKEGPAYRGGLTEYNDIFGLY